MNCTVCGALLPGGARVCPACGTPVSGAQGYPGYPPSNGGYGQGFDPTAYQTGGYRPQQPAGAGNGRGTGDGAYGQTGYGFDPTTGAQGYNGFPQGYQQVYGRYSARGGRDNELLNAITSLPRLFMEVFRDPGEALRGLMERNDRYTGGVVTGLSLLLTFLAAILVTRGAVMSVFTGFSTLSGTALAGDAASLNQGVNYIAGKMAASVGGIAVLCQLIAIAFPATVTLVYLCVVKKVRFSFLLASNLAAIVTLPSVAVSLLSMAASLLSPYAAAAAVLLGVIASYALLSALVTWITGMPEQRLVPTKIAVIGASEMLKILFIWLVGGALSAVAMSTVYGLIGSMGSLL